MADGADVGRQIELLRLGTRGRIVLGRYAHGDPFGQVARGGSGVEASGRV